MYLRYRLLDGKILLHFFGLCKYAIGKKNKKNSTFTFLCHTYGFSYLIGRPKTLVFSSQRLRPSSLIERTFEENQEKHHGDSLDLCNISQGRKKTTALFIHTPRCGMKVLDDIDSLN